jgi:hypothetical protein
MTKAVTWTIKYYIQLFTFNTTQLNIEVSIGFWNKTFYYNKLISNNYWLSVVYTKIHYTDYTQYNTIIHNIMTYVVTILYSTITYEDFFCKVGCR